MLKTAIDVIGTSKLNIHLLGLKGSSVAFQSGSTAFQKYVLVIIKIIMVIATSNWWKIFRFDKIETNHFLMSLIKVTFQIEMTLTVILSPLSTTNII